MDANLPLNIIEEEAILDFLSSNVPAPRAAVYLTFIAVPSCDFWKLVRAIIFIKNVLTRLLVYYKCEVKIVSPVLLSERSCCCLNLDRFPKYCS